MAAVEQHKTPIVPREQLEFGLDEDIPRHWLGGDAFLTRFFDALSAIFPVGERFFITTVRAYRDQVSDPKLQEEVRDFIRQEAQHSMIHLVFNKRLQAQGVNVDMITRRLEIGMFRNLGRRYGPAHLLAMTAAFEHFTAMLGTCLAERQELIRVSDRHARALFVWHAIEEVEHKAVAFDVLEQAARGSYWLRVRAMLQVSLGFPFFVAWVMNHMFKADGYTRRQRLGLWLRGMWTFHKPGGLFWGTWGYLFAYFRPGFHPWQLPEMPSYARWREVFDRTGCPVAACDALVGESPITLIPPLSRAA